MGDTMKKITISYEDVKTQKEAIMWHLQTYGNITSWEAIIKYSATRMSDIIWKMRGRGYSIASEWVTKKDGTRYKVYHYWGDKDER